MKSAEQQGITTGEGNLFRRTERRRSNRFKILLPVRYRRFGQEETFHMIADNISTMGMKFISHMDLFIDEELLLCIILPHPYPPVEMTGQVVWCKKKQTSDRFFFEGGIEFLTFKNNDAQMLEHFIDRNCFILY